MRPALLLIMTIAFAPAGCTSAEQRGQQLYAEHGCDVCHGADARGHGTAAGRLDTPPVDLTHVRAYRQGASQEEIAVSVRKGSGAMPAFRDLTGPEASDIAAWLVSLQQPATRQP